jgi:hypothetical protein
MRFHKCLRISVAWQIKFKADILRSLLFRIEQKLTRFTDMYSKNTDLLTYNIHKFSQHPVSKFTPFVSKQVRLQIKISS